MSKDSVLNHFHWRVIWPVTGLLGCSLAALAVLIPDFVHRDSWPEELVYGGYEDQLFGVSIANACLQFLSFLAVCLWLFRNTSEFGGGAAAGDSPPYPRLAKHATQHRSSKTRVRGRSPQSRQPSPSFKFWDRCGLKPNHPPWFLDLFQIASIVLDLVALAHVQTKVVVLGTLQLILSLLLVGRLLWPLHDASWSKDVLPAVWTRRQPLDAEDMHERSRTVAYVALAVSLACFFVNACQYNETFGTGTRMYRSEQLLKMNDDRQHHNRDLLFHSWSERTAKELAAGQLPFERVVLIVVDGLRSDFIERSPEFRSLVYEGPRKDGFWRGRALAALPTMSAPNWLTLLSGALPEVTGLHGNIFPGETEFDTLFSRQARLDGQQKEFLRGDVGCFWWSDMVKSKFPRYKGDGAVNANSMFQVIRKHMPFRLELSTSEQVVPMEYPVMLDPDSYRETWEGFTDDSTDAYRTLIAKEMLADDFRFLLVHFANPDTQAHYEGVMPQYNRRETYAQAVGKTAGYITQLLDVIDGHPSAATTTVIIVADHGEVAAGGHGGTDASLRNIPLLVYRGGGTGASKTRLGWRKALDDAGATARTWNIDDVAPTVNALLGLPVPRQSTGTIIWPLLEARLPANDSARDLYEAKRERMHVFLLESRFTTRQLSAIVSEYPEMLPLLTNSSAGEYRYAADRLDQLATDLRVTLGQEIQTRNLCVCIVLTLFGLAAIGRTLDRHTLMFSGMRFWELIGLSKNPERSVQAAHPSSFANLRGQCWLAACVAFLLTAIYIGAEIGLVLGLYSRSGYARWDSTMVHSPSACIAFFATVILSGSILTVLLIRAYHLPNIVWDRTPLSANERTACNTFCRGLLLCCTNTARFTCVERATADGHVQNLTWLYLVRLYMWFWSLLAMAVLLVLQGLYSFWIPFVYNSWVLDDTSWTLRFRIGSAQLMLLPLMAGNLAPLFALSRENAEFDFPWPELKDAQAVTVVASAKQPGHLVSAKRRAEKRAAKRFEALVTGPLNDIYSGPDAFEIAGPAATHIAAGLG